MSQAEVQAKTCEHGQKPDGRYSGVWAAPIDECRCCGIWYPYVDWLQMTQTSYRSRTWTKGRCAECGGHYEEHGS